MSTQSDLRLIQHIARELDENPVDRLGYTEDAFKNDSIGGVDVYDKNAEQNIPREADYNASVKDKGIRSQAGSIPRKSWNHYVGRLSFNLNKLVQKISTFFSFLAAWMSHNAAEYDVSACYKRGDVCYVVSNSGGVTVYTWYIRTSLSPETITGIGPEAAAHWAEMQSATSSSALLPFSAPGYRHKYSIADLTDAAYDTDKWYPVTTGARDFSAEPDDPEKDTAVQVLVEAFCAGPVSGKTGPHRAELAVLSTFTGFLGSSTDILLNYAFTDQTDGSGCPITDAPIGYSKLVRGREAVIWLRGGTKYALWNSFGSNFTLHTEPYANGLDDPIEASDTRPFMITPGLFKARVKSVEAAAQDDAVVLSQVAGALPLPKTLGFGAQLDSVRTPGLYVVLDAATAGSIQQRSAADEPGPFVLMVRGDKTGLSITVQQITFQKTGREFTRVLAGNTVLIPWYLSGSPGGLEITGFDGLYAFDIDDDTGNLLVRYDGKDEPSFALNTQDGHLIWYAPGNPERTLDLGKVTGAGISSLSVMYQIGSSGVTAPTGTWSSVIPSAQQGKYLWTKLTITITDGGVSTDVAGYNVSYYGIDGDDAPAMSFAIDGSEESPTYGHLLLTLS
jgi:hypothetical protein